MLTTAQSFLSFRSQGASEYGWVGDGSGANDAITLFANGATNDARLGSLNGSVHLVTGTGVGSERLTVIQNGNVGIGTTTPAGRFEAVDASGRLLLAGGATFCERNSGNVLTVKNTSIVSGNLGQIILERGNGVGDDAFISTEIDVANTGVERLSFGIGLTPAALKMSILKNGNIGIGTTIPSELLELRNGGIQVNGTYGIGFNNEKPNPVAPVSDASRIYHANAVFGGGDALIIEKTDVNDLIPDGGSGGIAFAMRGTDNIRRIRMQIMGNGRVGIGVAPTEALHVAGNGLFSGTVTASCGVLACSDIRYKKKIKPLLNSLNKITQLNGVTYKWKRNEFPEKNFGEKKQIGVIAQELEKFYPELVHTDKNGYKTVDYTRFTPILIEAIKEQQELIERLMQDNEALKAEKVNQSELNELKAEIKEIKIMLGQKAEK